MYYELLNIAHLVLGCILAESAYLMYVKPWVVFPPANKKVDSSFYPFPQRKKK